MIKPIAICLCMILLVSSSVAAFALTNEKKEEAEQPQTMSTGNTAEEQSNSKDETVYVIAGADGSVQKIIVSDWIKNTLGSNTIRDKSELTDVENVKSDESYTLGSDNTRVWDAQGNDIYYQGNIEKELPVGLSVTYKLDGKTVSPAELAGKSGKVTIRFDYTNQQYEYIEGQVTAAIRVEVTAQVTTAVREQVTIQVTEAIHQTITEQVIYAATGMDQASYDAAIAAGMIDEETQAAINAAIAEQMQSESIFQMIEDNTTEQMASESVQAMISANVEEQMQSDTIKEMIATNTELQVQKAISDNMAYDEVQAQFAAASEGAKSVISLKTSLDSYNTFYLGLQSYTAGVSQAAAGAGELKAGTDDLKSGTSKLYAGATELYDGILTLKNGTPALVDGITQLRDGSMQLSDGLKEFNEKGVQKLVDAVDGDLAGLTTRLQASIDVSKNYRSFAGIHDDMDGQVKFIYRTDAIES